ncbi:E2F transcription factor-like E2FF isoform X2 [Juglans microcarpa x Juglans regia]|uniref:E2F transcription factor-like E2FF isoform X2 n=1 Tax=Juglans microcarpa x Juglans regia TaxID=2249226 RepID=UPI001B7F4933|nr:E2F transcription factor-like E2FF isoform X2 [Juglans microcarpa x Juglans regia]
MSSLDLQNPETRPPAYHRKEKSLGLLCSNFLRLYSEEGVATFELDDAASKLGVERRRMYDVVNILESIRIIAKKGKNQYSWKGFGEVPRALEELKVSKNIENGVPSSLQNNWEARSTASLRRDNRRDKSLVILTQSFIKLFLCSDMDFILLDDAAQALLGDNHDTTALRTKVRRLYDIANVFSSMNMIEKTHFPESRKPAFRWLGWKEKRENGSDTPSDLNESKKRLFGIDITNDISKRNRVESSTNCINQTAIDVPMHNRHGDLRIVHDGIKLKQRSKHSSKGIEFGPFAPVNVSGLKDPERRRVIEFQENLTSTYRPQ